MARPAAGNLIERVTLISPGAPSPDGQGGFRAGTDSQAEVAADVRPLSGREVLRLGLTAAVSVIEVRLRYRESAAHTQRLLWQGRSYAVSQVAHGLRKDSTTLTCTDNGRG